MRVLVLGVGLVGSELAAGLVADGHEVVGTTTTPEKVERLSKVCTDVVVLRGSDAGAVAEAAAGCDAIAVCAGPSAARSMTPEERAATYREVLVDTAESVVAAGGDATIVALSSLSVYGDAADHLHEVTEDAPVTAADDPSPANFLAMERTYADGAGNRTCILRCADIYGADDPPVEAKVQLAHDVLGGSVPFSAAARFYRVHVSDVARAIRFAIDQGLQGVFNLTHSDVPPTNAELFDRISAELGRPPLEYRDEIVAPTVPISTARLREAGFELTHTQAPAVTS